jgi:hypothetical protein
MSYELQATLRDGYFEKQQPSDGEIYRKIRRYQKEPNAFMQRMWWARLTGDKARYLQQLSKNIELCSAFDALLSIPGLWGGMSLEHVADVMALHCDEVILIFYSF